MLFCNYCRPYCIYFTNELHRMQVVSLSKWRDKADSITVFVWRYKEPERTRSQESRYRKGRDRIQGAEGTGIMEIGTRFRAEICAISGPGRIEYCIECLGLRKRYWNIKYFSTKAILLLPELYLVWVGKSSGTVKQLMKRLLN